MSAGHFFVGLGAGIAILAVPVLTLTPGSGLPQRFVDWIEGPPGASAEFGQVSSDNAAVSRPLRGYRPGDPTPAPETAPTVQARGMPTARPTPPPVPVNAPALNSLRWAGTGVIRSGGAPVLVRRAPGTDSPDDPVVPDGSPVLIGSGPPLQVGTDQWRAVRGLNGVVGWVPNAQVAVDGEQPILVAMTPTPVTLQVVVAASGTQQAGTQQARGVIANTDGSGVVLRNSPNDADRRPAGLLDGMGVTVLGRAGADWVQVRADNGLEGWVPARYVIGGG